MENEAMQTKYKLNPLINKRMFIVSNYPDNINFEVSFKSEKELKHLMLLNAGYSKSEVCIEKDGY